jgi:tetratricopeptide (TPR) repeat protein
MASLLAGDRDGAIAALDRVRELTRTAPRGFRIHALVTLADLYARHRHDTRTAYELVHECLALVPTYSNAHFTHGQLLARDGQLFAARDAFGRAIAAGAHDAEQFVVDNEIAIWKAHSEIGATLMHERRFAEALAWFELASRARPDAAPLVINRAKCHEALGDAAAAATLFAAAAANYHDAASATEWINFLLRRGRTADALTAIEDALPWLDEDARTLCLGTAAAVHLRAGTPLRARDCVDRAVGVERRPALVARIECLAEHLGVPELAALVGTSAGGRAPAFTITYHDQR